MAPRIAILTPDPMNPFAAGRSKDIALELCEALALAGLEAEGRPWTDPIGPAEFDLVLPLVAWGYHEAGSDWLRTVETWEKDGLAVANPTSVLKWNADKIYLEELERRGAPIVPTLFVDRLTEERVAEAAEALQSDVLVLKPRVSASAWRTIRWMPGRSLDGGPEGPAMVQPYLPAIETAGEISMIYFGDMFSHAVRKRPQPSDFRVQPEYHGIISAYSPSLGEHETAERALAAVGEDLLYARVDLVRGLNGTPAVIELELVEPDLYMRYDPKAPARFAAAVRELIGR
jgi:glutathione synthase/RimK-type ligase-like ATP-grasp enzyme